MKLARALVPVAASLVFQLDAVALEAQAKSGIVCSSQKHSQSCQI